MYINQSWRRGLMDIDLSNPEPSYASTAESFTRLWKVTSVRSTGIFLDNVGTPVPTAFVVFESQYILNYC